MAAGQTIATIEAMKMEAAITAPKAGTVERVAVSPTAQVEGGDLLGGVQLTRIIAGAARRPPHRGAAARQGTRPTTDRVRESLFNVLAARLDFAGLAVLDLYAGSGALGLEALSRGAASAILVESDRRAAAVITAEHRGAGPARGDSAPCTVATVLSRRAAAPVDLVFADPPYDVGNAEVEAMLGMLAENGWVATGAIVVIERAASGPALTWPSGWEPLPDRRYGDTRLEMAEYSG